MLRRSKQCSRIPPEVRWIDLVKYALKFRVSFYILAILILVLGTAPVVAAPKDVPPEVNIPVVKVIWTYTGLSTKSWKAGLPPAPSSRSATTSMGS